MHLNCCKAFVTVLHHIPASKWERYGLDEWTVQWISNWSGGHWQRVVSVQVEAPQRSILGPALLIIISDQDGTIQCTLCKSAGDTKLSGALMEHK